jgi:hypothetical protein
LWYFHDKGLSTQNEVLDMMLEIRKKNNCTLEAIKEIPKLIFPESL